MSNKNIVLIGKSIKLEPLQEAHREALRLLSQDEKISTYSPALKLKFDAWFDKALKQSEAKQMTFVVTMLQNQQIIGSTRFYDINIDHKSLAIGYTWYTPQFWGTSVNKECKLLLMQYAFETLQINRIEFFIDSRNTRSRYAVSSLGATEEGILRQNIILDDGYVRDTVVYSILKNEWAAIFSNLNKKLYQHE